MLAHEDFLSDIVLAELWVIACDIKGGLACWQSLQWYEFLCQLCSISARLGKPAFHWLLCAVVTGVSMSQSSTLFVHVDGIIITNVRYYQGFDACLPGDGRALSCRVWPTLVVCEMQWHFITVVQWFLFNYMINKSIYRPSWVV